MNAVSQKISSSLTQSIWSSEQIRAMEQGAVKDADVMLFELMSRAGQQVYNHARLQWQQWRPRLYSGALSASSGY